MIHSVKHAWAGLRTAVPDDTPVMGAARTRRLLWLAGPERLRGAELAGDRPARRGAGGGQPGAAGEGLAAGFDAEAIAPGRCY